MVRLYGRDEAATLVRQLMARQPQSRGGDAQPAVLVCEGPPASGKTQLLRALAGLVDGRVPSAHLDLETVEAALGQDAVAELLAALAFQLARRTGRYGALRFPRLVVGHLVMGLKLDWVDREQARAQVDAALRAHRGVDRWTGTLGEVASAILARLPGLQPVPSSVLQRGLDGVVRQANRWGPGRRMLLGPYQEWYGRQDRDVGEPAIEALVGLNRWAAHNDNPDNRQRITELLLKAFLADLSDNFRTGTRADEWSLNCVVLLDNADCELGRMFLTQVVQARRDHAAGGLGASDPLTIVATSRGNLLSELDSGSAAAGNGESRPARGRSWWLRHELRPLSLDETNVMVASLSLPSGNSQRLAGMVRDLTGGQPAATHMLLDVIAERHTGLIELDEVLRSRRGGVSVDDALHARLLAGIPIDAIDDLTTCAAARDRADGRLIAQSGLVANRDVADAAALAAGLWSTDDDEQPTFIRRLLLRRLALRADDHPASWVNVHQWLYSDALQRHDSPRTDRYYAVALERWDVVTEVLTARLTKDRLPEWLAMLHAVSWAPRRPTVDGSDDPPATLAQRYAAPYTGRDAIFTTVINLLTSLSVARDPLCGSLRSGLYWQIAARYGEISHHTGSGSDELAALVYQYQAKARQWQQQPAPPQATGAHRVVGQSTGNAR